MTKWLILLLGLPALLHTLRRLCARSNTQVHRINQGSDR
jgi:hypothetical protein